VGEWESGRAGEWESGRAGEWESGRAGEWESGRVGERIDSFLPLSRSPTLPLWSERLAAGESGIDIVPPSDLYFAPLPAEIDDLTFAEVRKIA